MRRLYEPEAFLDRYFKVFRYPEYHRRRAEISKKANEGKTLPTLGYATIIWNLFWTLVRDGSLGKVSKTYLKYYFRNA